MSGHEFGGEIPPAFDFESLDDLYDSFRGAVLDDVCASLARVDALECVHDVSRLAMIEPERALEFLEQARLRVAVDGATEDNFHDVCRLAETYADIGRFDEALAIADEADRFDPPGPDETDQKTVLFRWNSERIPDEYLERAVLTIAGLENSGAMLCELYAFGEDHPRVRGLVLGLSGQVLVGHLLPEAPTPTEADELLRMAIYRAASWGDWDVARSHFEKLQVPAQRLFAELETYEETKGLLGHQSLGQLYEEVARDDIPLSKEAKVYASLRLRELDYPVDGEMIWSVLRELDEGPEKVQLISDFVRLYHHTAAREQLVASITEQYIEDRSRVLVHIANDHPGLLVDCEATILSWLLRDGDERQWEQGAVSRALLEDYMAIDRTEDAIELARHFEGRDFFTRLQKLRFQQAAVTQIAQRGREHFERALSLVAAFSQGAAYYNYGKLLSSLVIAAHDYLTPDERESYLQACDGEFMSYLGWLELAKVTKRMEYLVQAKQCLDAGQSPQNSALYCHYLLDILKVHQEITTEVAQ